MFEVASIWTLQSSPSVKVVDVPGLIGDDIHSLGGGGEKAASDCSQIRAPVVNVIKTFLDEI